MNTTTTTTRTATYRGVADTIGLAETFELFEAAASEAHLIPYAGIEPILDTVEAIRGVAVNLGLRSAGDLARHATDVLRADTGEKNLTAYLRSQDAETLHRARNVLGAVLGAAIGSYASTLAGVAEALPALKMRSREQRRPLEHDEILLCRLDMWHTASRARDGLRAAGVYALCETGATPGETTEIALDSFDDVEDPSIVILPGNNQMGLRLPDLDDYARQILRPLLRDAADRAARIEDRAERDRAWKSPLTYLPRKNAPGSPAATASAQGVIDRLFKRWGLANDDVTAFSVPLWRVATTYTQHGIAAAREVSGRPAESTLRMINVRAQTAQAFVPAVRSFGA